MSKKGRRVARQDTAALAAPAVVVRAPSASSRRASLAWVPAAVLLYGGLWALLPLGFMAYRFPQPFLTGLPFYHRYSGTVGGPIEYVAGFFTCTYSRPWAGALAFTLLALAAWAIARGILRRFSSARCTWPAAAFPLVILVLAGRDLPVLFILPMVAGLAVAWFFVALRARPADRWTQGVVVALCLVASFPVYWALASGFLHLCAVCALYELVVSRRPRLAVVWILAGAAIPYLASTVLFEPGISERYLRWMPMPRGNALAVALVVAMCLFVPVGALVGFLIGRFRPGDRLTPRLRRAVEVVGFAALALLAGRLVALRFDTTGWIYAAYLEEEGRPTEALASLAQSSDDSDPIRFLTLLSLARAGRLPWDMFHYPQRASSDALLLQDTAWDSNPAVEMWRSDVYLELGRVNDSLRWANEAVAGEGQTPRVLERLALAYVLNGNADAARTFARALEKVPFHARRARQYLDALDRDPGMRSDPRVARIRPLMLRNDYPGTWSPEPLLLQCLDANPSNRMAFEYLLAHYLLATDMKGFATLAPRLEQFYPELPTHVQEALLGFRNLNGSLPPGVDDAAIHGDVEARFRRFIEVWAPYQNGRAEEAWRALAPEFGDTYWFFYLFGRTAAGPPPQAGGDAAH